MAYVKKLVMHGFKSFASRTELPFDQGINVIIGPNGSGKSNITDALCFVLGRLSIKSMRAAKAANLLFQGSHEHKPAHEASVEIVFDNSDKSFAIDSSEVTLKRIVRRNGLGIYKINNETKTRQEILELLAQAGIDPNGFNLVLQGEIARLIKMRPEERREIIEEVAGISIYESRKEKSLSEIEKTEQKLKEVNAVLRERTIYLKNLEQERKQALRFKELEKTVKQCKASIINRNIEEKVKEIAEVEKEISRDKKYKEKIKSEIEQINSEINVIENKINEINQYIQKTTGFERESLNEEITDLNVKIAADRARKDNYEKKLAENEIRKRELETNLQEYEKELETLKKNSPLMSKRQEELKKKKQELEKIQEEREKLYSTQSELNAIRDRIRDKERLEQKAQNESKFIFNQIREISENTSNQTIEQCNSEITQIRANIEKFSKDIDEINAGKLSIEKKISVAESELERNKRLKTQMPKSDTCPLCQSKLSESHVTHVLNNADDKIKHFESEINGMHQHLIDLNSKFSGIKLSIQDSQKRIFEKQAEMVKLKNIEDKKEQMKRLMEEEKLIKKEINELEETKLKIDKRVQDKDTIEQKYQKLFFEMQEISSRTDENLDTSILYKEREMENIRNVVKNILKDKKEIQDEVARLSHELKENGKKLDEKDKASRLLSEKFKKLFEDRTTLQEKIKQKNIFLVNQQNALSRVDDAINNFKINIAKISAARESLEYEFKEFTDIEILPGSVPSLQERLQKSEQTLMTIGSVNLRALETYDEIKQEYENIAQKVAQLEKERDEILKIIHEIDIKKKKTFMKTFDSINELFTRNFSQLSVKGKAFLEIENKEDIFAGGVNITIKIAQGKYFDVTSLSGGEQTLVALSLIFAIQEYKPYCFYILDEIDAALDKRNSELLANLLKKYIQSGQYIIISHNDSIISGANVIYGVSMNSGLSKIISLKT
ncbi:MAG: chromosome segregation SMC family protein [Candidatus Pacearchaeota archaeon]|jgi:chromosome segregation protein